MKFPKLTFKPVTQITLGLLCLTISILLVGELLGLMPDPLAAERDARRKFAESVAVQFSSLANWQQSQHIERTVKAIVERNEDIASAAVRSPLGHYLAGNHLAHWQVDDDLHSSSTQIVVPIYDGKYRWGSIELRFQNSHSKWVSLILEYHLIALLLFVTLSGAFLYRVFIKRALRELDPSGAIPERVRSAFDALAEGVMIIDEQATIVLANGAFEKQTGYSQDEIVGQACDSMEWSLSDNRDGRSALPWLDVLRDNTNRTNVRMLLNAEQHNERIFLVNCVAITDADDISRGVLTTFDDVSELEEKNRSLKLMLGKLEISQQRVKAQNEKLHLLATRDPMTNCLNRRSFYTAFEQLFQSAQEDKEELAAIMVDIDHFKSINDSFGHSAGDEVIKVLAGVLHANSRDVDLVARYGGEEFSVVLKGIGIDGAQSVANRILVALRESNAPDFTQGKVITASLGVSSLANGAKDKEALLDEADRALYVAKEGGRNQVVCWSPELESETAGTGQDQAAEQPVTIEEPVAVSVQSSDLDELRLRIAELEQITQAQKDELEALLQFDSLTGLKTRDPFHTSIGQAIARGYRYEKLTAVVSISISTFRRVNDTLGHEMGSALLTELVVRLESVLRSSDVVMSADGSNSFSEVSRLSSDEFGLLISDLDDRAAIESALQRIQGALTEPLMLNDVTVTPACTIGVSVFPDDGSYAELLTHGAALARQEAELSGQPYLFYNTGLQHSADEHLRKASA